MTKIPIRFTNTLSRTRERFRSREADHVGLYVCGPTVYGPIHLGNARPLIVFDVVYRMMRALYSTVTYVRNITDIDDKIIAAAQAAGVSVVEHTRQMTRGFHDDCRRLGLCRPTIEPTVSGSMKVIIEFIEKLLAVGVAYRAHDHVLFHVPQWPSYGLLSGRSRDDMVAGSRIEVAPYKRDPADFVLWKPSPSGQQGWPSPFGYGRPGWHIECSAMAREHLGEAFDIHGGGNDLIFPHHENELAQTCSVCGSQSSAAWWLHNGMITLGGQKMSKSAGVSLMLARLLAEHGATSIRWLMMTTHYRSPLDITDERFWESDRWASRLRDAWVVVQRLTGSQEGAADHHDDLIVKESLFWMAMGDDLNTSRALAVVRSLVARLGDHPKDVHAARSLRHACEILGFSDALAADIEANQKIVEDSSQECQRLDSDQIERMVREREKNRAEGNFSHADEIRNQLAAIGVTVSDTPDGPVWEFGDRR